jgi:hypothetical protein
MKDFVSFEVLSLGGSPPADVDICPAVVSGLS